MVGLSSFPQREALQPERTALAWQRTAVTALVAFVPLVVVALRRDLPFVAGGGGVAMAVSAGLVVSVRRRLRQLDDDERGYSPLPPLAQVAAITVLCAVGGVVVAVARFS
ncbi:hypothetical protein ASC58_07435 [Phycicoccus sp. Root101]|nr:hypothetical protein ASC58_07435 [Phycicoccus sp. Root101]